jgi:rare lipoprotein A
MIRHLLILVAFLIAGYMCSYAQEQGKASYYSHRLHGRRMSDGTKYHKDSMICAHNTYPLGTLLRVRNLNNGKEVVVRVADRGPHRRNFKIDLSYAAAKELGFLSKGFELVEITPYDEINVPFRAKTDDASSVIERLTSQDYFQDGHYIIPVWQQKMERRHEAATPRTPATLNTDTTDEHKNTHTSRIEQKRAQKNTTK